MFMTFSPPKRRKPSRGLALSRWSWSYADSFWYWLAGAYRPEKMRVEEGETCCLHGSCAVGFPVYCWKKSVPCRLTLSISISARTKGTARGTTEPRYPTCSLTLTPYLRGTHFTSKGSFHCKRRHDIQKYDNIKELSSLVSRTRTFGLC